MNITATLGTRGQVLQVHAGSAKAAVGTGAPSGLPTWVPPCPCPRRPAVSRVTLSPHPHPGPPKGRAALLIPHACRPPVQMR